jgi:hypothetical protein
VLLFTPYAEDRLLGRRLSRAPGQLLEEAGRRIAQSRYTDPAGGGEFLIRVIYEPVGEDKLVITAYQTSKVGKYWRDR